MGSDADEIQTAHSWPRVESREANPSADIQAAHFGGALSQMKPIGNPRSGGAEGGG